MKRIASFLVTLCLLQSAYAATAVPDSISYQGRALTATGALMGTGTPVNRTVTFRVWDHATNSLTANLIYSEQQVVTIAEGEFSVLVGTGTATGSPLGYSETNRGPGTIKISDAFGGASRYLGVTIDDGTTAVDNEISPRQQIVAGAFAMRSKVAEGVDGQAITTAMLANNSVTTTQVNDAAITTGKLAANAVTAAQIAAATITGAKIATDTLVAGNIATGAVGTDEILDGTIATGDIANLAVTTAKIADGAITGTKIATGTIPLAALVAAVQEALVPAGTIVAYGGTTAPTGWFLCDGTSKLRADWPALSTAIGTAFGTSSVTTFNVPDFRGRFLRGKDYNTGRDPDRAGRLAMTTGGSTGDNIGSIQEDALKTHAHQYALFYTTDGDDGSSGAHEVNGTYATNTTNAGDSTESRPKNAYVNYIIKY